MKKLLINSQEIQSSFKYKLSQYLGRKPSANRSVTGFTLLELLVVIAIAAILAAIAAPGWLSFTNQRRVTVVNEEIYRSLQDAQREARRTKRNYSVSLRVAPDTRNNNQLTPQIALHSTPINVTDSNTALNSVQWKNLGSGFGVNPNQIVVYSNLQPVIDPGNVTILRTNKVRNDVPANTYPQPANPANSTGSGPITITFDYQGILPPPPVSDIGTQGLLIGVGATSPGGTTPFTSSQRCVVVTTLLGAMETRQEAQCNPWPTTP